MVEKVDLKASACDLKPQTGQFGHLESFFLLFYFSTFLPESKMVEKVDLESYK